VTSLEPDLSCGQLDNKAQGFALGSLARLEQFVQSFTTQIKNSPIHRAIFYLGRTDEVWKNQ